jgi:hypothetical protein
VRSSEEMKRRGLMHLIKLLWVMTEVRGMWPSKPVARLPYGLLKEGARGKERLIHSYVHLESLRGNMRMMLEDMEEGNLDASMHGGAMGAWSSIYLW